MDGRRRTNTQIDGSLEATAIALSLGRELRITARRRHMTQAEVGRRAGLSRPRIGELVRGEGATAPLGVWVRVGKAIDRPLAVAFFRSTDPAATRDAGHLAAQEIVLGLARRNGRRGEFELPTRPADPARSIDVVIRDDASRAIVVIEIWNRLDDLGAAVRASTRKASEAEGLAVLAARDDRPYRVADCWLFVETAANRRLVAHYPEILRSRFPGSSVAWVRCLVDGAAPPNEPGLAWIDTRSGRIRSLRHRRRGSNGIGG